MLRSQASKLADSIMAGNFYSGQSVLVPDATVMWECYVLPNRMGTLILSGEHRQEVVHHLAKAALHPNRLGWPTTLEGSTASVRPCGALAVKRFKPDTTLKHNGREALKANVGLSTGMHRVKNTIGDWKLVAPEYFGAHFCHSGRGTTWIMSFEAGKCPPGGTRWTQESLALLPDPADRKAVYGAALNSMGFDQNQIARVAYDDKPDNTLVRLGQETKFELVKLDLFISDRV